MGGGKSSGNQTTTVQMTPEQQETLRIQNEALKNTFLPAYGNTITGAKDVYNQTAPAATAAANKASNVAGKTGALQGAEGAGALTSGVQGLQSLFDPNYEQNQILTNIKPILRIVLLSGISESVSKYAFWHPFFAVHFFSK